MTFDIKQVKIVDLDGNSITDSPVGKEVGNLIYAKTTTLDWLASANLIHANQPAELTKEELEELLQIINHPSCKFILAAKDALTKYITQLID